jgi:hypothetical protein
MKNLVLTICCTLISLLPLQSAKPKAEDNNSRFAKDHIIVKLRPVSK